MSIGRDTPGEAGSADEQAGSHLAAAIGPCFTVEGIARALHRSPRAVLALVEDSCLLALTTADDYVVFPAFQLHNGRLVRGVPPVLTALRTGVDDPWAWALWLNSTPLVVEGIAPGVSRIQQLIDGEAEIVLRAAERTAWSWRP